MNVKQRRLKSALTKHKQFVRDLRSSKGKRCSDLLASASDQQLELLIKVFNYIVLGEIPMSAEAYNSLVKKRKSAFFQRYFSADSTKTLLSSSRAEKIHILSQFKTVFEPLLHYLFHK